MTRAGLAVLGAALLVAAAPLQGAMLTVGGEVATPLSLSADDLRAMPRRTVRAAAEHGGSPATYEGVALGEVLRRAGTGELRGRRLTTAYALVEAADGYRAVFALAELDSAFTDKLVLLADRVDGKPLPADVGPLRLVVPDEKRHGRWVRQVKAVRVLRAPD